MLERGREILPGVATICGGSSSKKEL